MHNIIEIHHNVMWYSLHYVVFTFNMNDGVVYRILSIPHNIIMDMNNVVDVNLFLLLFIMAFLVSHVISRLCSK